MADTSPSFAEAVRTQYDWAFGRPWPVLPSALMIGALNVFLFAFDRPWTASDGLRNWGDGLFKLLGLLDQPDLTPPHLYSGSLLNLGLLLGGLIAALLGREFGIHAAPLREAVKGALGGGLMGVGAMLAFGCNIGGFFSALSALSLSGIGMMAGLLLGGFGATQVIIRERAWQIEKGQLSFVSPCESPPRSAPDSRAFTNQPFYGAFALALVLVAGTLYQLSGHGRLALFLYFGLAFGVIFQRSRFCLVNAFREPFLSGRSEHARAAALALMVSMIGMAILKAGDLKDAGEWVFPSFWFGSLVGGAIFGFGMTLAEGCGAGTLWRVGEGHVKLWIAMVFFAVGASSTRNLLVRTDWIRQLGSAQFMPHLIGWPGAVVAVVVLMSAWYLISAWNEGRRQVGVLKF
jgi:uncharacterized membrane protein YedE/YeeE